jgi:hypothetical protein
MTSLRRHLFATTWIAVSSYALVLALATAHVCWDREHTHQGSEASDCPMHHGTSPMSHGTGHHEHQGHATTSDGGHHRGPQIACRCPQDILSTYLGPVAIVEAPVSSVPFVQVARLDPVTGTSALDLHTPPPSPPPR